MDSAWLVPLSLAFGAVAGASIVIVVVAAHARSVKVARLVEVSLPDGIDAVLDALESAGVVVDPSGNVLKASPRALQLGLVSAQQHLVHAEIEDLVALARREGEPQADELTLARLPGSEATFVLGVRVAPLGGRYVLVLAEDRSEGRRLDDMRRDFVANISHELKTPIGAVGLLAEALESASSDPEQVRHFAKSLTREAGRLGRLTQDIIELSRLQATDALESSEPIDVRVVVDTAVDRNRVVADARGISLVVRGGRHATVLGDEQMLVTAVDNLIANAINYSPDGSRVGIGATVDDSGTVEVAVTDQGYGIPDDELDRVFERFYRVDPARSRRTGGTGLGLAIVKHVIQNHGGDVRVWSQVGKGSTFTLRLPEARTQPETRSTPLPVTTRQDRTARHDGARTDGARREGTTRQDIEAR
ncbi:ATP-binding protein [Frigoribacterium sp. CFBP9039]|uniref:sensor histidine kinase n=1 Tax=Frigoribacterium sp. CFBP9029 TaxID=3096541 RepID=UPI002A6A5069|nr:ATP-binding protein [Frigoribacterium sp. CFBP9039]MDY0945580.1 ATP-binding protein [Frigoribacterium sp. CFBP9039]